MSPVKDFKTLMFEEEKLLTFDTKGFAEGQASPRLRKEREAGP